MKKTSNHPQSAKTDSVQVLLSAPMFSMVSDAPQGADLQGNLLSQQSPSQAAWQALADAAKALYAIASAQLGKDVSCLDSAPVIQPATARILPLQPLCDQTTVVDAVNALLTAKAAAERSDRYLEQLRYALSSFSKGRGRKALASVTAQEVEQWAGSGKAGSRTRKNRILYARLLFSFARKRGWIIQNPADAIELPSRDAGKIAIHTPAECKAVLSEAMRQHKGVARALAVRYFAGLRSAELVRLVPENIHLDRGFIEVPAKAAKTRRRRLVKILPNLARWIEATEEIPGNLFERIEGIRRAAGVDWPNNVTRHSFVSYHLAAFESAGKTALEAGHSEAMLFAHYRELVTPQDAAEYWAILPGSGDKKAP